MGGTNVGGSVSVGTGDGVTSGVAVGDAVGTGDGSGAALVVGDAVGLGVAPLGPGVGVVTMTGGPAGVVDGRAVGLGMGLGVGFGPVTTGACVGVGDPEATVGDGDGPRVELGAAVAAALVGEAVTCGGGVRVSAVAVDVASAVCEAPNTTDIGALEASVPDVDSEADGVPPSTAAAITGDGTGPSPGGSTATFAFPSPPEALNARPATIRTTPSIPTMGQLLGPSSVMSGALQKDSGRFGPRADPAPAAPRSPFSARAESRRSIAPLASSEAGAGRARNRPPSLSTSPHRSRACYHAQ